MKLRLIFNHFIEKTLQGIFWLLPIGAVVFIIFWLYDKIDVITRKIFDIAGFELDGQSFIWVVFTLIILIFTIYIFGIFVNTKLASLFEALFAKVPGYSAIKDIVNIFNSSKKGETKVLVVAIRGFGSAGYNIGLMYSQKESVIKDHYTITLSQSPIPNGGFMFEIHKKDIFVIRNATFDNNLQYLLSMGVKSLAEILKTEPKNIDEFIPFEEWLKLNQGAKSVKSKK
jgi:uncharacterized membrane protein